MLLSPVAELRPVFFVVKIGEIGSSVKLLDLRCTLGNGVPDTCIELKSSTMTVPLSAESAHPPGVHSSWPKALLTRLRALSVSSSAYFSVLRELKNRFTASGRPFPNVACATPIKQRLQSEVKWCPLPFHPVVYKSVVRALSEFNDEYSHLLNVAGLSFSHLRTRVAWKNFCRSLGFRVR